MIHVLSTKPTPKQLAEMQKALGYIKVAVDIDRQILAGGGVMHADCEEKLLEAGSKQKNIWGGDWYPKVKRVEFHSLINIRPRDNNRSIEIQDKKIRAQVEKVIRGIFE